MRYMLAYMIRGEAGWKVRQLSDELSDVFAMDPISRKIAPHLTLKSPFETNNEQNIENLKMVLAKFTEGRKPAAIKYDGFGQFDRRVIFVHVKPSAEAVTLIDDLMRALRVLPWLKFGRTDGEKRLHATICYAENRRHYEEIKKYLQGETIQLDGAIDHLSILVQEGTHLSPWKLLAEYGLSQNPVTSDSIPEL